MQYWSASFANYKISFYHLLKSCDCREDNQMTPSKPKPQKLLCYSGAASPGPPSFLPPNHFCFFLSAAPDPGQYSFDNNTNNDKGLVVTDKCQDRASQECGKETTALEPQHSLQLTASHQQAMAMKSSSFSAFLSFICLLLFISSISATCFYPDGSIPSDYTYTPCGNAAVEPCCTSAFNGECVSGGLCKNDDDQYYIGACTDQTWESSICPNYCKNGE